MNLQPNSISLYQPDPRTRRSRLISLTPLIDVVFILLVFFMLASSFHNWQALSLHVPGGAAGQPQSRETVLLEIKLDQLRLSGQVLSLDELPDQLTPLLAESNNVNVLINVKDGVAMQRVVSVLDVLERSGVSTSGLVRDAHW